MAINRDNNSFQAIGQPNPYEDDLATAGTILYDPVTNMRRGQSNGSGSIGPASLVRAGSNVEVMRYGSGAYVNTGPANRTWQLVVAAKAACYAARLIAFNPQNTIITLDAASIVPSTTYVASGDPTGGASIVPFTWGGSASVAMPASGSTQLESLNASDWVLVPPLAWTNVDNGRALLYVRMYFLNANYSWITSTTMDDYADNVVGGLIRQWTFRNTTGDVTGTTGYVGQSANLVALPMQLELRQIARQVKILCVGDSTYNCGTYTAGGQLNGWPEKMAAILNDSDDGGIFYSASNAGWSSQTLPQYLARINDLMESQSYDYVIIEGYSPNVAPTTQAALNTNLGYLMGAVDLIRSYGAVPIISTGIPATAVQIPTAAVDAIRLQCNETIRQFCQVTGTAIIDIAPELSDGATPQRMGTQWSSDGTHITTTLGQDLWAEAAADAIRVAF